MTRVENIQPVTPAAPARRDAKLWDAAKQFEQVLVEQLAKQLQETAQPAEGDGEDGDGQTALSGLYTQMLPGALAQGVADGGGLGLAQQLYDSMAQREPK
jgi:Rod binding domain-containing protein